MSVELGESEKKKPKTVEFYYKTQCGVDVVDQMARHFSVEVGGPLLFLQHSEFGRHQCVCAL